MFFDRLDLLNKSLTNQICTNAEGLLEIDEAFSSFKSYILECKKKSGIVYVIGNGGSAGIASHFSNDLIKALKIPSMTLFDSNILTCLANDYGYEKCFSENLKVNMRSNDLLVAISSSGNSLNIINAVKVAKEKEAKVVALSGFDSANKLRDLGDLNFWIDKKDYGLVEMGHFIILHTLIDCFNSFSNKVSIQRLFENV